MQQYIAKDCNAAAAAAAGVTATGRKIAHVVYRVVVRSRIMVMDTHAQKSCDVHLPASPCRPVEGGGRGYKYSVRATEAGLLQLQQTAGWSSCDCQA